jgi:CRISPR/Cas system-associated exonuclease Cas4 (RecB family)
MKIQCSGGKGVLPVEDCYACALSGGNVCGYDCSLLKAIFGSSQKSERANAVHVTDLTGCLRRSFYDKTEPKPEFVHEVLARWLGTAMHAAAEGSDELYDSELPLEWDGLKGTADVVYKDGRVVDYKSTRWLIPQRLPYGSHALQVNIYAHMLRRMGREVSSLAIQYVDMSGPTKCRRCKVPVRMFEGELRCPACFNPIANAHLGAVLYEIPLMSEKEIESLIAERKEILETSMIFGSPPAREPGYLCAYCAHREVCNPDTTEA